MEPMEIELLARAAHEVNRVYCMAIGDHSQVPWEQAPEWQRTSAMNGVRGVLAGNTPKQSHDSWLAEKQATGWKYGPVKDAEKKEHPCMVSYADLPDEQRRKDTIYVTTVCLLADALGVERKGKDKSEHQLRYEVQKRLLERASQMLDSGTYSAAVELLSVYHQVRG